MPEAKDLDAIWVPDLGIDVNHARGFVVDVRQNLPFYTFSHYKCPIILRDQNGCREWPPGVAMVCAPDSPRYIRAESSDLENTWFHCSGPGVAPCLAEYGVPVDTVMDLGELPFLKPVLEEVRTERAQQLSFWEDAVSDLIRGLFRELGALKADMEHEMTPAQRALERKLRDVRVQVHSDLRRHWTVPEMASLAMLHPNWFATVYTRQFGISPINDLLNARIKHAEALLKRLPMTVEQVARTCGFARVEHFTRLFHQRTGLSPGQVRKQNKP